MKKILLLLTILLAGTSAVSAAESASDIIARAAGRFSSAPSVSVYYSMTTDNGTATGEMLFSGQRFHISAPQLLTWYDGTTQWTYLPQENEVSISEPTADELQQVNPFAVISTFQRGYNARLVKSDKTSKTVALTAQSKTAEIQSATITLTTSTMLPSRIDLTMKSGQKMSITITSISVGKSLNINAFRFPKARYPKAEIVDLR
ncbi:MAG: outer-membrane lipoprotein carrier protein LolA [Paramuribaculum sp.]|nr:outer-membrane lipoprotein carrier protein LolA [Paramuribaculum sp.]